ncbi:MAG: HD domain-containing protein [Kiritimatiellae bacterium]|nr:HD domain-containing protein [Kiritimatiellia bacterium]
MRSLGGRAWLVGGCVRDALLGRPCHDFDLEVYGVPAARLEAALAARWPLDKVGASFGVVKLKHHDVDIALPRRENRLGAGHRDFSVSADPDLSPAEAAARRDFTVNAVMFDPLACEPLDPHGGVADLRAGVLRHVSEHFSEDPLRVLRGMQFLARFPFLSAAPELVALCASMTQDALPRERLAGEWEKLFLQGAKPSRGLEFLRACGWLRFYPELAALVGVPQDPVFHPEGDVWTHTLLAVDAAARLGATPLRGCAPAAREDRLAVAVAALCHDLGKPAATARGEDGRIHAYDHENLGVPLARGFCLRLWNQEKFADLVSRLVAFHMRPVQLVLSGAGDKAYRRLAVDAGRPDLLADVVECDVRATAAPGSDPAAHESLAIVRAYREKCAALAIEREAPKPIVLGRDLIARGMKPGPDFGPILEACYEAQLAGGIEDPATGAAFLDAFLAARAR